jgi:hypothetical protein
MTAKRANAEITSNMAEKEEHSALFKFFVLRRRLQFATPDL